MNLKPIFETQVTLIDEGIKAKLAKGDTRDILHLVEAELMLAEHLEFLEEPEQEWPEGSSEDRPEQEDADEQARRKKAEERGFYG